MDCAPDSLCTAGAIGWMNRRMGTLYSTSMFGGTFTGEMPVPLDQYVAATLTLNVAPRPGTYQLRIADGVYTSTGEIPMSIGMPQSLFPVARGPALVITVGP